MDENDDKTQEVSTKTSLLPSSNMCGMHKMKFILGISALLLVDIIWVASSQLTRVSKIVYLWSIHLWPLTR